jgi:hypothetical protein
VYLCYRCVPYRQVCLGHKLKAGECRQYKCGKYKVMNISSSYSLLNFTYLYQLQPVCVTVDVQTAGGLRKRGKLKLSKRTFRINASLVVPFQKH